MTIPDLTSRRIAESEALSNRLGEIIRRMQGEVYIDIIAKIDGLEIDAGGKIRYSLRNLSTIRQIEEAVRRATEPARKGLMGWIIEKLLQITGLNEAYFRLVRPTISDAVESRVLNRVMVRFGYDLAAKKIVLGGWLDAMTSVTEIARRVAQDVSRAIAGRMGLAAFRRQFRQAFLGAVGRGYVERHFSTFSFDLFQQADREVQNAYSEELSLPYALYAGTIKNNTRDFCLERVRQTYSREEIAKWEKLEFKGKIMVGYNPAIHCGGYNCRHHLSWVSEEYVEVRGIEVNKYNPAKLILA